MQRFLLKEENGKWKAFLLFSVFVKLEETEVRTLFWEGSLKECLRHLEVVNEVLPIKVFVGKKRFYFDVGSLKREAGRFESNLKS